MVQSINSFSKPTYNAVKINIKEPAINQNNNSSTINDNGNYNAVDINIDNPSINPIKPENPKDKVLIYDYPQNNEMIPFDLIGFNYGLVEVNKNNENDTNNNEIIDAEVVEVEDVSNEIDDSKKKIINENITFKQKPEIVPGEEIKPAVDLGVVLSNLNNENMDVQAQQMEEIARVALENPKDGIPYLVTDLFSSLVDIAEKDSSKLNPPTEKQIDARKKVIANFVAIQNSQNQNNIKLPFNLTPEEIAIADEISPMEQAERNKEYALYTMAILSKIYVDEVKNDTGNVIPITDLPGVSTMIEALRFNQNAGVKIAAIDSLNYIQRPEYKEELKTLFTLAQKDSNPLVANSATNALEKNTKLS